MSGRSGPASGPVTRPARSLYVHAPFCARRCFYCDFAVSVRRQADPTEWAETIGAELALVEGNGDGTLADPLRSLYVGGGTPSLLGPTAMELLAEAVGRPRLVDGALEWTAEANPESLTPAVAEGWRRAGVNRISLGAQTFHEPALRWMGRLHGAAGPGRAVAAAREAGIGNVSVDLIFGLPAGLGRDWRADLGRAVGLDVPHISLYGLTVEARTPLGRAVREGREAPVDETQYEEEYMLAADELTRAGYDHYEVSSFARSGARSVHNSVYWGGEPYLGLGNGAHSFAGSTRRWNERDWETYRDRVREGRAPEAGRETVQPDAARLERIWLGLRTDSGVEPGGGGAGAVALTERWIREGLATPNGERVRLTARGWLLLDALAVDLDAAWLEG